MVILQSSFQFVLPVIRNTITHHQHQPPPLYTKNRLSRLQENLHIIKNTRDVKTNLTDLDSPRIIDGTLNYLSMMVLLIVAHCDLMYCCVETLTSFYQ